MVLVLHLLKLFLHLIELLTLTLLGFKLRSSSHRLTTHWWITSWWSAEWLVVNFSKYLIEILLNLLSFLDLVRVISEEFITKFPHVSEIDAKLESVLILIVPKV